nr:MAG TPA: hypothetical protein [Caudoviricetes sp.]
MRQLRMAGGLKVLIHGVDAFAFCVGRLETTNIVTNGKLAK